MHHDSDDWAPDQDKISALAYQYWEERGYAHGNHEDDWYRAEQEIRKRRPDLAPAPGAQRTVVGMFRSLEHAQRAADELDQQGFPRDEISFVVNQAGSAEWSQRSRGAGAGTESESGTAVAADAGIGAALGGVGGLLLAFAGLAVPGVGPVLAAGPMIAALGGAGIGAAAGGLIGALTDDGVPEEHAKNYAEGVRRGDILVTVHASGERADAAAKIMDRHHAVNIDDRVSGWRQRGWTGHDAQAQPLTESELRREREYTEAAGKQGTEWANRSGAGRGSGLAGAEAANAKRDAARSSKAAKSSIGAGRRDVGNQDMAASVSDPATRVYQRQA